MNQVCINKTQRVHLAKPNSNIPDTMSKIMVTRPIEEKDDAFFCCELSEVIKRYQTWTTSLPGLQPSYSIKCNSDSMVLQLLTSLGASFACTNKAEIKQAMDQGINASHILFANPCKQKSHIKFAAERGVSLMTFDSVGELYKIKALHPCARLVLSITVDKVEDQEDDLQPNLMTGADPIEAESILQVAKDLSLNVVGVSFSLSAVEVDVASYPKAIAIAREITCQAQELGFNIKILNIGEVPRLEKGEVSFNETASVIRAALQKYFPEGCGMKIYADSSRYLVTSAFTIAVNIIAKREVNQDIDDDYVDEPEDGKEPAFMYYVNDGVYSSFNCMLYDGITSLTPSTLDDRTDEETYSCSIWGPTCDGLDCLTTYELLAELEVGDWIIYDNMGAFTQTTSAPLNGMIQTKVHYTIAEEHLFYLYLDRPRQDSPQRGLAERIH